MTFRFHRPKPSPDQRKILHLVLAGGWALLVIPTMLWWKDSILWVLMISLYANFVGHLSAAEAAEPPKCPRECCADV